LAVQRACARVVAVAPLPGRRDWSSGVGPSRHGELGDSQHFSQEYSHECCYRRNSLRTTVVFSARIFADRVDSAASLKTA